jgi:CBS domain-containing protein
MKMQVNNILAVKGAHVVTIQPGQLVREAVALLAQHNIGALPVVDAAGLLVVGLPMMRVSLSGLFRI